MSSMNANQHHIGQGESSSRSRPSRPSVSFPSYIHCGYNDHHSNDCLYYPTCETYGSYDHDTQDHNDIKWFRKGEALQAKNVESFKASKNESPSALRLKTPTKTWVSSPTSLNFRSKSKRGISINKEKDVNDLLRMYDKIGLSMNTPIMPPNMSGPDLNIKAVNESQYRGMIGPLMNLIASKPNIQFSTTYARHQANIRILTLPLLRIFSANKQQSKAMFSMKAKDIAAAGCYAIILWIKSTH
ncbi:hypothetical protein Tco_1170992 [Tanacetum coccineum]